VIVEKQLWGLQAPNSEALKLDIHTGKVTRVATGPLARSHFVTDAAGRVTAAYGSNAKNQMLAYHRPQGRGDFMLIGAPVDDNSEIMPWHFDPLSGEFWAMGFGEADTNGLYRWNPMNGVFRLVERQA